MVSFVMIMLTKFMDGLPQGPLAEQNHPFQARFLDGSYESFGVGIQIRRARRQLDGLHSALCRISRNSAVNKGSRSWIKYRLPIRKPSAASLRLRATWLIQRPFASRATPAIATRRLERSIKNSTRNLVKPLLLQNVCDRAMRYLVPQVGQRSLDSPVTQFDSPWPCGSPDLGSLLGCADGRDLVARCHHISWQLACGAKPAALPASRWSSVPEASASPIPWL
jgi:hypothetical protein